MGPVFVIFILTKALRTDARMHINKFGQLIDASCRPFFGGLSLATNRKKKLVLNKRFTQSSSRRYILFSCYVGHLNYLIFVADDPIFTAKAPSY